MKITENAEIEKTFRETLEQNEPVIIECILHPNDIVHPMILEKETMYEWIDEF